ncbi:MAG TPA: cupin domain-containing protein [Acidimicrobiales bacterium]|jgi:quercetin dioxygenase-like cupin family protein|nr:cupin domain-containing protein [Acidimicrobiales bacterium]
MEIQTNQPSVRGPADFFTGDVWIDAVARGPVPARLNVNAVHFAPGARTAWHSHDGGQTLYVTEGKGQVQSRGDRLMEIRPGDVVSTPDGEEHWHGAARDHFMTHLSITQGDAHWGDQVTDAEYGGES